MSWLVLPIAVCGVVAMSANAAEPSNPSVPAIDARSLVLEHPSGSSAVEKKIIELQEKIGKTKRAAPLLVQLGWAYVTEARVTSDPGYYNLAEFCAQAAEKEGADDSDVLLLRGDIAHAMHRFAQMEEIGRKLTTMERPRWESLALLGDALMEQGKLGEAIDAYQRMIDIRPCLQTYARVAHVRWLKGDLEGAAELMVLAVQASSERDPEPAAWAYVRLANYQLQAGDQVGAARSAKRALEIVPDYTSALLVQAKLLLNEGNAEKAIPLLEQAAKRSPLPETQWLLADAARAAGNEELAARTENIIRVHGKREDPRSLALFLASRRLDPQVALQLAQQELDSRRDIFTFDAIAWSALAAGDKARAQESIEQALKEGTSDARLLYHAGKIAIVANDKGKARTWFAKAASMQQTLLPSERADLRVEINRMAETATAARTTSPADTQLANIGRN